MPAHNLDDIDERDLSEAPRLAKNSESKGVMIALAAAAALFVALLVYSSFPELSPEEIISMDGYEGEQPTKNIFNIHSFNDDENTASSASAPIDDSLPPIAVTEPIVPEPVVPNQVVSEQAVEPAVGTSVVEEADVPEPQSTIVTTVVEGAPATQLELIQSAPDQTLAAITETVVVPTEPPAPAAQAELPIAVTEPVPIESPTIEAAPSRVISFNTARGEKVVAAMATTPTIEEAADTIVITSAAAIEPVPIPVSDSTLASESGTNSTSGFLPLRSVLQDETELKLSKASQSETLLVLRRGVTVTVFESDGEWSHIGTNDGSSITGYVFESSLGDADR